MKAWPRITDLPRRALALLAVVLPGVLVVIGVVVTSASAGTGQTPSAPPSVGRVAREMPPGAKSVIVFVSAGGKEYVATAGTRRPKADQRFRIGSLTKTFTATIVLQLAEEGKLRLDSTLSERLPGVVPRGEEITIRHLLQHRSGLADFTQYPSWLERAERSSSTRPLDLLRFAASKPLDFEPGTEVRYSNTNYIALGLVIERVTDNTYAQELNRRVLDPLELDRTELPTTRRLPDLDDRGFNPNVPWAAGAIVSSARELARFYSALLSGRMLSSASLNAMKDTVRTDKVGSVGLGIFSTELACGRSWSHAGGILDYGTLAAASEDGRRVAVLSVRGGRGWPPPVERALLCPESRPGAARAGRRILYTSSLDQHGPSALYVANPAASGQRWLTLNAPIFGRVAWSPDGRRIAFESVRDGNSEIYVVNADGSGQRRLTGSPAYDGGPTWSPDGRKVAFVREGGRKHGSDVYVMNADGSRQRRLLRRGLQPLWSPDGRRIAVMRGTGVSVVNADGKGERNVTRSPARDFAWSPDGRRIAFESVRDGNSEIYVVNADGSGQRRLTRNPVLDGGPVWSPDGKIAFESDRDGNFEIYVMNADGSGQRRLTRSPAYDGGPAWSPDGRKIAFRSDRDGNFEVYVMNADGSGRRNLTRSPWNEGSAVWSPEHAR